MKHEAHDALYELMPLRVTNAAWEFFRNTFRVIDFEAYVDWVSAELDETSRNTGMFLLKVDEPLPNMDIELIKRMELEGMAAVKGWKQFEPFHAEGVFSLVVDSFLTYVTDLLTTIYKTKPQALRSGEQVRIDEVLRFSTMDELIEFFSERKVHQLFYQGMKTWHRVLEKELSLSIFKVPHELERAILLVEKRNLVRHARGIVNKVFLQRQPYSGYSLGERLKFDRGQVTEDILFLAKTVANVDVTAVEKFKIDHSMLRHRPTLGMP